MSTPCWRVSVVLLCTLALPGWAAAGDDLTESARSLVSKTPLDTATLARLRAAGPAGMEAVLALAENEPELAKSPAYRAALDAVCAQKDCAASRLFWYTDLEAAKAAAARRGRPILSLRLLGRLDEELSCANSRFFRTVLYADESVADRMREGWVLHWRSVRPVPKVTVDFGDGRRLEGTITGNSLHYLLDSNGRLLDALPGLYAPEAFRDALVSGEAMARTLGPLSGKAFQSARAAVHRERYLSLERTLARYVEGSAASATAEATLAAFVARAGTRPPSPSARQASAVSASKSAAERPMLAAVTPGPGPAPVPDDQVVALIAKDLYRQKAGLKEGTRALLAEKLGGWVGPANLEASIRRFEELIAEDTARNEHLLHAAIHARLATAEAPDLDRFTDWVYESLFLTPPADPWMGLAPREVFSVLTPAP